MYLRLYYLNESDKMGYIRSRVKGAEMVVIFCAFYIFEIEYYLMKGCQHGLQFRN